MLLVIFHLCPDLFLGFEPTNHGNIPGTPVLWCMYISQVPCLTQTTDSNMGLREKGPGEAEPGDPWGGTLWFLVLRPNGVPWEALGRQVGVGSDLLRASFVPQGLGLLTSPCSCGESGPVGLHLAPPALGAVSSSGCEGREEGLGAGRGWGSTFQERTRRVGTGNPALSRGGAKHTCTLLFSDHLSSVRQGIYSHPPSGPVGEEGAPPPQPGRGFYPATPLTCSFLSSPG